MSQAGGFWNWKIILIGAQMLFVAFGAMVLMPLLTGLDPSVALFTAGWAHCCSSGLPAARFLFFWRPRLSLWHPFPMGYSSGACRPPWGRCSVPLWSM